MLKRINDALPGLVGGILLYGVCLQLTGVWFASDRLAYSVGLWFGAAVAVGLAVHIATVIYDSVTLGDGKNASRRIIAQSVLRYAVVAILFLLYGYFELGSLLMAFIGVLGLKVSAYLQPLFEKIGNKLHGRGDAASGDKITNITDKEVI
ncbi:MAG: hypothetical protein NC355_00125 [Blautia sp.]|nr:hypothetical protein [Blautia sp.]